MKIFIEKNSQINLSAIRESEDIIKKHFVDSVFLNTFIDFVPWDKIVDMWTGWWFPLLPLAIVNPEVEFVWIDSVWKKLKSHTKLCQIGPKMGAEMVCEWFRAGKDEC